MKSIKLPVTTLVRRGFYRAEYNDDRGLSSLCVHGEGMYWIEWADYWRGRPEVSPEEQRVAEQLRGNDVYKGEFIPFLPELLAPL